MFYKLYGVLLVIAAFVVELLWLVLLMYSVVGGIVVLVAAPSWLLLPFDYLYNKGFGYYMKVYGVESHRVGR